jgi:hypothetical protein
MATAAGWKPTLKYSPRNGIIVDWAHGSQPFSMCCLPQRDCTPPTPAKPAPACTTALPMAETVETRDWHAFVPEILAGISGATEDMAAAYARQAGIEFAQKAWVLQRDVVMELQPKIYRYPFEPIGEERVVGALFILSSEGPCACNGSGGVFIGEVSVDQSRQELVLANTVRAGCCGAHVNRRGPKFILVRVFVQPTEDSCQVDAFMYERWRQAVTRGARAKLRADTATGTYQTNRGYASSRGDGLVYQRADREEAQFMQDIRHARREMQDPVVANNLPAASMFGG